MCGVCKHEMRIRDYMMVEMCPRCKAHLTVVVNFIIIYILKYK